MSDRALIAATAGSRTSSLSRVASASSKRPSTTARVAAWSGDVGRRGACAVPDEVSTRQASAATSRERETREVIAILIIWLQDQGRAGFAGPVGRVGRVETSTRLG